MKSRRFQKKVYIGAAAVVPLLACGRDSSPNDTRGAVTAPKRVTLEPA